MLGWIFAFVILVWGLTTIYELAKNDGAFGAITGTLMWLFWGGGAAVLIIIFLF